MALRRSSGWNMWSMPQSVLRIVAGVIGLCAMAGLVLGVLGAPEKGHLPGEPTTEAPGAPLVASELLPMPEDLPPAARIEKPKSEDAPKVEEAETAPVSAPAPVVVAPPTKPAAPEDRVGDLLDGVTPPPQEDPPH